MSLLHGMSNEGLLCPEAQDIQSVRRLFDVAESAFADRPFLVGDQPLTYRQVGDQSCAAAGWLVGAGVARGDRVLIAAANHTDVVLIAIAAFRLGAVVAVLHEATTAQTLMRVAQQIRPVVTVFDRSTIGLRELVPDSHVVALGIDQHVERTVPVQALFATRDAILPDVLPAPDDPVCVIFTSGSSGEPHGVVVSHDNVIFTTAAIQERLGYRRSDVIALVVPLSFDYGLYQIFLAANVGASVHIAEPGSVGPPLLPLLARHEVTILPAIPGLMASVLKMLDRGTATLPSLRCITSTGDHLPATHVDALQRVLPGVRVFPMYGLTECKRVSILLPEEHGQRPGTVGRPLAGTTVRLVGANGDPVSPGEPGELIVGGRHVALGYWHASEESERRFRLDELTGTRELWTGDTCHIDNGGFLRVLGRTDALLKHHGFRISSVEIELVACRAPGVIEAAVVCSARGDLHLFARCTDDGANSAGVRRVLRDNLEWFKVPAHVHVVDELPRTLNGKTDRTELAAMANAC